MSHGMKRILTGAAILVLFVAGLVMAVMAADVAILVRQGWAVAHPEYVLPILVFLSIVSFASVYLMATPTLNKPDDDGWRNAEWVGYKYGIPFSLMLAAWLGWCIFTVVIAYELTPIVQHVFANSTNPGFRNPIVLKMLLIFLLTPGLIAITNFLRSNLRGLYPDVPLVWVDGSGISIAGKARIPWQGITQIDLAGGDLREDYRNGRITITSDTIAGLGRVKINAFGSLWSKADLMWKLRECAKAHGVVLQRSVVPPLDPNNGAKVEVYNS